MGLHFYISLLTIIYTLDIRKNIRVTMVNALQIKEPGFGPGVLREFLSKLIKESFDPNGGLFCSTDQEELYPNPQVSCVTFCHGNMIVLQVHTIMKDYHLHYYFIGRLLGKSLYENLVLELPLASFFMCKILSGGVFVCVCILWGSITTWKRRQKKISKINFPLVTLMLL